MAGETNLQKLLQTMSPVITPGEFVFCSFENAAYGEHANLQPIAAFAEAEGLTLVVPKQNADAHGIDYESIFSCITLKVHSSLDAVGLTAAFATKLTEHNISANVIAGFFHDHIFVPQELAGRATSAIEELSR